MQKISTFRYIIPTLSNEYICNICFAIGKQQIRVIFQTVSELDFHTLRPVLSPI